jgi:hypothetical protein
MNIERNITVKDVYCAFRKAQSNSKNRPFRIPKNFEKHLEEKMSDDNRKALIKATKYFNTKWNRIDPDKYMESGFEIFKNFTYTQFFNPKVLNLYSIRDKIYKMNKEQGKKDIINSVAFLLKKAKENGITFEELCQTKIRGLNSVVSYYLKGKIDGLLLSWLIDVGVVKCKDNDLSFLSGFASQYRKNLSKVKEMKGFMNKIKKYIRGDNNGGKNTVI